MTKEIKVVFIAFALMMSVSAHAQKSKLALKSLNALTGEVPSAFSQVSPLSGRAVRTLDSHIMAAEFSLANPAFVSSKELFKRVQTNAGLQALKEEDVALLATKFAHLDEDVRLKAENLNGYRKALRGTSPAGSSEILLNPGVESMVNVLDIQQYMQMHHNEFPNLFTVNPSGWLIVTDCLASQEGNDAFHKVLDILIREQFHQISPVVAEHLAVLHATASNPVPVEAVVTQLKYWREAHHATEAPRLPKDLSEVSLRSNPEQLWLAVEIRLLQLTPGIELPAQLQGLTVTQ